MMDTITIDDLDRQLAQCLGVDGRASFSQLAEVLGVSDQTVARRYRRLRSAGLLRVVGLKARKQLGSLGWFLRIRCVPGAGPAIAAAQRAEHLGVAVEELDPRRVGAPGQRGGDRGAGARNAPDAQEPAERAELFARLQPDHAQQAR